MHGPGLLGQVPVFLSVTEQKMTRAPILFRVDGTPTPGWESFWRCLTCAGALQRRRRPTYFLSRLEPAELAQNLKRGGNDWIAAAHPAGTEDDLAETLAEVRRLSPAAVIVDSSAVAEPYLRSLRASGTLVVSLDHLAQVRFPSHLVVNPLLGPGKEAFEHVLGTQLLLGVRYALVRPEVRRLRPLRSQEPAQPFRILIALGDDDPHNQAGELAKLLLASPRVARVDIALRSHHPELPALQELALANTERLELAVEPAEVAARITRCHFALTAGNGWSLDLACVGVPQLVLVQEEHHWPTAQRLEEEGAATCLGWHETVSAATIRQAVQTLLADPAERQAMSRCGRQLIDGRGPDRFVTALEVMLHPTRRVPAAQAA
jgi:spore coat polysaccharide biosynthesis predicted glycosyltransferase SpsG